jgi:hypothetical protein
VEGDLPFAGREDRVVAAEADALAGQKRVPRWRTPTSYFLLFGLLTWTFAVRDAVVAPLMETVSL